MLVLSRGTSQIIKIGDDIEVTIVEIEPNRVRVGVKAPPHVKVHRKEVYDAIRAGLPQTPPRTSR